MTSKLSPKLPSQKVSRFFLWMVGFSLINLQEDLEELGSLISFANLEHVVKFGAQLVWRFDTSVRFGAQFKHNWSW